MAEFYFKTSIFIFLKGEAFHSTRLGVKRDSVGGHHHHHQHENQVLGETDSFRNQRRLEECYCIPSHQCPSESIVYLSNQIPAASPPLNSGNFNNFNNFQQTNGGFEQLKSSQSGGFIGEVISEGISGGVKDYSGLIDPRTLPKDILAKENSDTLDLSEQRTLGKAR